MGLDLKFLPLISFYEGHKVWGKLEPAAQKSHLLSFLQTTHIGESQYFRSALRSLLYLTVFCSN